MKCTPTASATETRKRGTWSLAGGACGPWGAASPGVSRRVLTLSHSLRHRRGSSAGASETKGPQGT